MLNRGRNSRRSYRRKLFQKFQEFPALRRSGEPQTSLTRNYPLGRQFCYLREAPLASAGRQGGAPDAISVFKASRAVGCRVVAGDFLNALMRLVLEISAADKACLLLEAADGLSLAATASAGRHGVQVQIHHEAGKIPALPWSIIDHVHRTAEKVILGEDTVPPPGIADTGGRRGRPKTAAGLPVSRNAKVIGVLYLESRQGTHAFTRERLERLELLLSQAVVSLEKATFHSGEGEDANKGGKASASEGDERFLYLTLATRDALYDWDIPNRRVWRNEAYRSHYSLEPVGTEQTWWERYIHPDDRQRIVASILDTFASRTTFWSDEYRFRQRDGSFAHVLDRGYILYDSSGEPLRMIGAITDITARKEAEERLREGESRIRRLVDSDIIGVFFWKLDGAITGANDLFLKVIGYARQDLDHIRWTDITAPEYRPVIDRAKKELDETGKFTPYEKEVVRKDGTRVPVLVGGALFEGSEGEGVSFVLDLTELKKTQLQAESGRDRIDAILKSVPEGLLVTDLDDQMILMNHSAEELLGTSSAQTHLRHIDFLLSEENLRRQIVAVRQGNALKAAMEWEETGGSSRPSRILQARTTAVRSPEGRLTGTITTLRDITREREIDRIKDEFISTAAHELRTPLATIMGFLQLLQRDEFTPEERREFINLVYEKSEVLEQIIGDLLDLSRVQAGRLITVKKSCEDLAGLAEKAVTAYHGVSDRQDFELHFPEAPVFLCLDPGKIGQVLENLLSNAVKFSPGGGLVQVSGARRESEFQITVADQGIGMGPEQVARAFDKFYRADASNTAISGLGLGMTIARNIIDAHGGRIWIESRPGQGTQVHFTLPLDDHCCVRQPGYPPQKH